MEQTTLEGALEILQGEGIKIIQITTSPHSRYQIPLTDENASQLSQVLAAPSIAVPKIATPGGNNGQT